MNSILKKAGLGVALAATALTVAAPAEAQRYYRRDRDDGAGTALVAGIAGLAVGAAIASSSRDLYYDRGYRREYYNRDYYDRGYYDRGYNGYYDRGYYPEQHGYYADRGYYRENCRVERRWDRYADRPVLVRVCY